MKTFAIILSGGSGSRFNSDIPKQLSKLGGKTILEHTLKTFQQSPLIDAIVVVTREEDQNLMGEICRSFSKIIKIVIGGTTRYASTNAGLVSLEDMAKAEDNILIHDAARPFISETILQKCIETLRVFNAIDVVVPSADTIVEITTRDNTERLLSIPNRSTLRRGQTPQGFKYSLIKDAYSQANQNAPQSFTDDCSVLLKYYPNEPIICVPGEESNIKITHPQDIFIADKLLQLKLENPSIDLTEQLHDKVIVVFGGAYGIGAEIIDLAQKLGARVHSFSRSTTQTDIQNLNDIENALKQVHLKENKIDYIINTAAILCMQPLEHMDYNSILSQVNVNYLGAINIAKASIPYLRITSGQLLLFTSSSYTLGRANYSLYSSSKAAIVNLTQALAEEWQSYNIRINCICPERTKTPMRSRNFGIEPEHTLLDPHDVAIKSLRTLVSQYTGSVIKVTKQ